MGTGTAASASFVTETGVGVGAEDHVACLICDAVVGIFSVSSVAFALLKERGINVTYGVFNRAIFCHLDVLLLKYNKRYLSNNSALI